MAYFLFIDESGQDHRASPYEVLAGVAIHDTRLWDFIQAIQQAEVDFFGTRVTLGLSELKARALLSKKTFQLAAQLPPIPHSERRKLAEQILTDGTNPTKENLTALGQAKFAFTGRVLDLCTEFELRAFASIIDPHATRPPPNMLRKDYAFLFERFFYFVEDRLDHERGVIVFDEVAKSGAHLLVNQMAEYFQKTSRGKTRANRIVPEPFFVHSDLTSCVQVADLVAYIISWAVRFGPLTAPVRPELDPLAQKVKDLRYRAERDVPGYDIFEIWSFKEILDLEPTDDPGFDL